MGATVSSSSGLTALWCWDLVWESRICCDLISFLVCRRIETMRKMIGVLAQASTRKQASDLLQVKIHRRGVKVSSSGPARNSKCQ